MRVKPIWYLIIGIFFLIVPTAIYLGVLIPKLSEEYNILLSSGGVIATGGMYGSSLIPEKVKFSSLFKMAARSFTILTVITLVQEFIMEIMGCVVVFIISFIVFSIFKELWKNGKRRKENRELAEQIAQSIAKTTE